MSSTIKNVIVVPASGLVGKAVVAALLESPYGYSVSALTREESSYTPPAGVTHLRSDYSHESLVKALKGQDAVVSAAASGTIPLQIKVIDAAIEACVRRFVASDYGSDTRNKHSHARVPFFAAKHQIQEYLKEKEGQIEWTSLFTGPFLDGGIKSGFLGYDLANKTATLWDEKYKDATFTGTRLSLIAKAVVQSLSPSIADKTANKVLPIADAAVTPSTLLAALEKATGSTWTRKNVDFDELTKKGLENVARGDFSLVGVLIVGNLLDVQSENDFEARGILENELLGIEGIGLQKVVNEVVAEFNAVE
ncbi:uncharacterized protein PADG_04095 [Paracoccidioides brasiliensis Pb18]|uniref:NmrA-like domain-containing protein n=2 Tax=Paracoccidioides brasiliensis TaxID=121759 RepID=C1GA09_PARBD|nr:uncharacterized protein PADG_04095 [Paracoccidioides brasiliensis Pb18]EEH48011.1 hypothetical protein PADG_04095 [Paracoccidioides brasiliensis Pb18]ODH12657.1 hypothetical protein ACO22_08046 [Paracoccidioides brasiliensis]